MQYGNYKLFNEEKFLPKNYFIVGGIGGGAFERK